MKIYLVSIALSWFLVGCYQPEKERALRDLEHCHRKLADYHEMAGSLSRNLESLQHQWEEAEDNIVINLNTEFRNYRTKKERMERVYRAFANKEEIEESIEKTILTINHLTDSVLTTQVKIRDAQAVITDYEYLTFD